MLNTATVLFVVIVVQVLPLLNHMKEELKELIVQFLRETANSRQRIIDGEWVQVSPSFEDFIDWLT